MYTARFIASGIVNVFFAHVTAAPVLGVAVIIVDVALAVARLSGRFTATNLDFRVLKVAKTIKSYSFVRSVANAISTAAELMFSPLSRI